MKFENAKKSVATVLGLWAGAIPTVALAGPPGNGPLVGFGQTVLNFLSGTLGPVVFGIGLAMAAISLVMGSRDGVQKAIYTIVGGALLFSVGTIVQFVEMAAR